MSRIESARVCRKTRCQQQFGRPTLDSSTFEHIAAFVLPRIMHIVGNSRMASVLGTIESRTPCPDRGRFQPDVDQPMAYRVIGAVTPLELISEIFPTRGNHMCLALAHSPLLASTRRGDQAPTKEREIGDEGSISIERVECSTASSASAAHSPQAVPTQFAAIDRQEEFGVVTRLDTNWEGFSLDGFCVNHERHGDSRTAIQNVEKNRSPLSVSAEVERNADGAQEWNARSKRVQSNEMEGSAWPDKRREAATR
jgi:hypothetical protein